MLEIKTPNAGETRTRRQDGMVMVYVPAGEFLTRQIGGLATDRRHDIIGSLLP